MIHEDSRTPLSLFIDTCTMGAGTVLADESYHTEFLAHTPLENHPICHLEALNAMVGLITWEAKLHSKLVHLYSDNTMAVLVFQASCSMGTFPQACTQQLWLI